MTAKMKNKINSGFSLIEMVIYVAILAVISIVVINMLLSFTGTYKTIVAMRAAENSGIDSMERMTRDIRAASSVDTGNSTLGTSPGVLTLVSSSGAGTSTTTKFYVSSGVLKVNVNNEYIGPLTGSNASTTSLVFRLLDNGYSKAIKIDLSIDGQVGGITKSKTYHSTIILRGQP